MSWCAQVTALSRPRLHMWHIHSHNACLLDRGKRPESHTAQTGKQACWVNLIQRRADFNMALYQGDTHCCLQHSCIANVAAMLSHLASRDLALLFSSINHAVANPVSAGQ